MKIIIIGAGPAGSDAALAATKLGHEVILFTPQDLGGVCLNEGCIPTKTLLEDALHLTHAKEHLPHLVSLDASASIMLHKDRIISEIKTSLLSQLLAAKVTVISSRASFIDNTQIQDDSGHVYTADKIIIATGARPHIPPLPYPHPEEFLTSQSILSKVYTQPQHFCVLGAGVIGLELSSYLKMMGHHVVILETAPRILMSAPKELATSLHRDFNQNGIDIKVNESVQRIEKIDANYHVVSQTTDALYDQILVATGRKPNLESLHLSNTSIVYTDKGIQVNQNFETTVPHIYAIGDVNGGIQLAHVASDQGHQLIHYLTTNVSPKLKVIPYGVYTPLQIAWAGLTEDEAKRQNKPVNVIKTLITGLAKQKIKVNTRGYIKFIMEDHHRLLGVEILSADATELIATCVLLIEQSIDLNQASETIFPHPTLSEALKLALQQVPNKD